MKKLLLFSIFILLLNTSSFADFSWTAVTNPPNSRTYVGAGVLSNKIYLIGGGAGITYYTNVYEFDGSTWTEVIGLPEARASIAVGTLNNKLYIIGGKGDGIDAATNVYEFTGSTWIEVQGLPLPANRGRLGLATATLNNKIYAIAGNGVDELGSGFASTNVYEFDGSAWTEVIGLPSHRIYLCAAVLNSKIYAIGGYTNNIAKTNVYEFNGTTWTEVIGLPAIQQNHAAVAFNSKIYSIGGRGASGAYLTNVYEFNGTTWTEAADLPVSKYSHGAVVISNGIYVIAGSNTNAWRYYDGNIYVATNGTGGGLSWLDATNDLQGAIIACQSNYTVWVSNGTYVGNFTNYGGITIRSKSGLPADVILDGNAAGRVMKMLANAWLSGVTISNGLISSGGGAGIQGGYVSNCIICNNNSDENFGGGAYQSILYNCIIRRNSAGSGGGIYDSFGYNSLIYLNEAISVGGGGCASTFYNCTVNSNTAVDGGGGGWDCTFINSISWNNNTLDFFGGSSNYYSCGVGYTDTGSITNDPLFISLTDFRLKSTSPCIDTGNNVAWDSLSNSVDLNGSNRIYNVIVDMGAYEWSSTTIYSNSYLRIPNMNGIGIRKFQGTSILRLFK